MPVESTTVRGWSPSSCALILPVSFPPLAAESLRATKRRWEEEGCQQFKGREKKTREKGLSFFRQELSQILCICKEYKGGVIQFGIQSILK